MKKRVMAAGFLIICILFMGRFDVCASDLVPNDETGVPDKALYQEILQSMDKSENDTFTKQEAASLESLHIGKKIQSFQGIGVLRSLKSLDVSDIKLGDSQCEAIATELPQLELLSANDNKITSLHALGNLKRLEWLNVCNNKLENLEGIEELTSLESLYAESNQIKKISLSMELPKLKNLDLSYNQLTDVKGIERMHQIEDLHLSDNQLTNLKGIKKLKNLRELDLSANQLKNLKGIENLNKLEWLLAEKNLLTSVKGIRNLKKLTNLWVGDNRLVNVNEVKYLKNIRRLLIDYNQIKKLPNLKGMKRLYSVELYGNFLTEQEIRKKLPERYLSEKSEFISRGILLQRHNFKVSFINPAKPSKITKKTKKITGKVPNEYYKKLKIYLILPGEVKWLTAKLDKTGKFAFKKLNLKPYAGKEAQLSVYYYDNFTDRGIRVNQILFKIKK